MKLPIDLRIEGTLVDMYKDEGLTLKSIVKDLQDPKKLFTGMSRSFTVPASKTNNKLFKHYNRINLSEKLDARRFQEAQIELNGEVYRYGNVSVEGVNMYKGVAKDYKLRFYGKLTEISKKIGQDKLSNLDLTAYNISDFDAEAEFSDNSDRNIVFPLASRGKRFLIDSSTNGATSSWGQTYPNSKDIRYSSSGSYVEDTYGVTREDLVGAIKVGRLLDAIEIKYGFTFNGAFTQDYIQNLRLWLHKTDKTRESDLGDFKLVENLQKNQVSANTIEEVVINSNNIQINGEGAQYPIDYFLNNNYRDKNFFVSYAVESTASNYEMKVKHNGVEVLTMDESATDYSSGIYINQQDVNVTFEVASSSPTEVFVYMKVVEVRGIGNGWSNAQDTLFIAGSAQVGGEFFYNVSENLPDMKVIDFLGSLFKMFNIIAEVNNNNASNPNLVTDGTFANGGNEWLETSGVSYSSNIATISVTSGSYEELSQSVSYEEGKKYKISFNLEYDSSTSDDGSVIVQDTSTGSGNLNEVINLVDGTNTYELEFTASADSNKVYFKRNNADPTKSYTYKISNVEATKVFAPFVISTKHYDKFMSEGKLKNVSQYVDIDSYSVNRSNLYSSLRYQFEEPKTVMEEGYLKVNNKKYGELNYELQSDGVRLIGQEYKMKVPNQRIPLEPLYDLNTGDKLNITYTLFGDKDGGEVQTKPCFTYTHAITSATDLAFDTGGSVSRINDIVLPSNIYTNHVAPTVSGTDIKTGLYFSPEVNEYLANYEFIGSDLFSLFYSGLTSVLFNQNTRRVSFDSYLPTSVIRDLKLSDTLKIGQDIYRINSFETNFLSGKTKLDLTLVDFTDINAFTINTLNIENTSDSAYGYRYMDLNGYIQSGVLFSGTTGNTATVNCIGSILGVDNSDVEATDNSSTNDTDDTTTITSNEYTVHYSTSESLVCDASNVTIYADDSDIFSTSIYSNESQTTNATSGWYAYNGWHREWTGSAWTGTKTKCEVTTPPPPTYNAISLGYSATESNVCSSTASTYYSTSTTPMTDGTAIYSDSSGTTLATAGWYKFNTSKREWNGSIWIGFTALCI